MRRILILVVLTFVLSQILWAEGGETCEDATLIEAFNFHDEGSTVGHVLNYPPNPLCVSFSAPDVVYKYIAPDDMNITVSLCGSDYNTVLDCWTSPPGGGPACPDDPGAVNICCNEDYCDLQSCCQFYILGGHEAYFIVTGSHGSSGNYVFDFFARFGWEGWVPCPSHPPVNDDCINALEVTVEEAVYGTTRYALWDLLRDEAPDCITPITAPGVWYMVTGTGNILTATTCNLYTNYDTKLNVYAGSCDALMCITGNDNDPYCSFSPLHSKASWYSLTGVVYRILVQGAYGQVGEFGLTVTEDLECPCDLSYTELDMGDLPACNYPTIVANPAHALTGVAWLGQGVTGEPAPLILDADAADDGVIYHNLPWMPCQPQVVTVTVTAGPMYDFYVESCGGLLFLNGWMDGNLDGDFCDTLCTAHGVFSDEWIVQNALVVPGEHILTLVNPGVVDTAHHDGIFRWRLTEVPVGREGFGLVDPFSCSSMTCGTLALSCVGEVEDYILEDALEPPRPFALTLYHGTGGALILRWIAPLIYDYLIYSTTNPNHDGNPPGPDWVLEATLPNVPAGPAQWADLDGQAVSYRNYIIEMSSP